MDPEATLRKALDGDRWARLDYNLWIERGGFAAKAKAFVHGDTMPRLVEVRYLGPKLVRCLTGLVHPKTEYIRYENVIAGSVHM